jgi:hypothetical protein
VELLKCSKRVQAEYRQILDVWRKIHYALDTVTSDTAPADVQEATLARVRALRATFALLMR